MDTPAYSPQPFYQIWLNAVTRPNEQTYRQIAFSPQAKPGTAYLWLFLVSLISGILSVAMLSLAGSPFSELGIDVQEQLGTSLLAELCAVPIGAIFSVLLFAIWIAIIQWIARLFGGQGTYGQLIYTIAAAVAPLGLLNSLLSLLYAIPYAGLCFALFTLAISFYLLYIQILAIKTVNSFGWLPALGAFFLPGLMIVFLCACLTVGALVALGPSIEEIFNQINQSLMY